MKPHHRYELRNRIERVYSRGAVQIDRDDLLSWFECQRITVNVWREIYNMWHEISGDDHDELLMWEGDGFYQFICVAGFTPISDRI